MSVKERIERLKGDMEMHQNMDGVQSHRFLSQVSLLRMELACFLYFCRSVLFGEVCFTKIKHLQA